jgi:hypothetical protein
MLVRRVFQDLRNEPTQAGVGWQQFSLDKISEDDLRCFRLVNVYVDISENQPLLAEPPDDWHNK